MRGSQQKMKVARPLIEAQIARRKIKTNLHTPSPYPPPHIRTYSVYTDILMRFFVAVQRCRQHKVHINSYRKAEYSW